MSKSDSSNHYDLHTYPNGLRLITVPMEHTKSVTVLVMVATGSRYETKEINGISHFLEHMMFKGTTKRPGALDISQELDSLGAEYNAFTSKEYTGYYVKCAANKVDVAMDIISFETLMYGDQPLGWEISGEKKTIDKLQRNDLLNYFNSHYFAQNTVIAIAGNIETNYIKEKVSKYFDKIREHKRIEPPPTIENQKEPCLTIQHKKTDQTHIVLGFRSYSRFDPKHEALEVLSMILGGGMSSRLFVEIREKRGLSYRVQSGVTAYDETGNFGTYAGFGHSNLAEGLKVILDEHKKLTEEMVSEQELKRVKDQIQGSFVIGLEQSDDMASFYGEQELLEHKIETPEQRLAKITAVTREDILEVARDVFKPEKLNLAIIGPLEGDNKEIKEILNSW
ncbi:MAG: insulinase family protein [Candidatus Yanofskybacteria bacterium]|nr:insulinase family protein [Candidatus Yanofskybacteria bacterium]